MYLIGLRTSFYITTISSLYIPKKINNTFLILSNLVSLFVLKIFFIVGFKSFIVV